MHYIQLSWFMPIATYKWLKGFSVIHAKPYQYVAHHHNEGEYYVDLRTAVDS